MVQFDIIKYISSLTGFVLDKAVCERIAMERGVSEVTSFSELTQQDKDLLLADVLFTVYMSPNTSASITQSHGEYSQTIGSQTISSKDDIYNMFISLYRKWNDDKLEDAESMGGSLQWLDY